MDTTTETPTIKVADISMSIKSMISFMLKWYVASVLAALMLAVPALIIWLLLLASIFRPHLPQ